MPGEDAQGIAKIAVSREMARSGHSAPYDQRTERIEQRQRNEGAAPAEKMPQMAGDKAAAEAAYDRAAHKNAVQARNRLPCKLLADIGQQHDDDAGDE